MTALGTLILIAGIATVIGIAVGMTRWSFAKYAELREVAAASDQAMREVANALGLRFVTQGGYEHPLVGTVPGFASLEGELDGVPIRAFVVVDTENSFAHSELVAELPARVSSSSRQTPSSSNERYRLERDGAKLKLLPKLPKKGSWLFIAYQVVTDGRQLSELLRELARLARDTR